MAQEMTLHQALDWILQARRDAWDLYRVAAKHTRHEGGYRMLERLAEEQRRLARQTFKLTDYAQSSNFDHWFVAQPAGESAQQHKMKAAFDDWIDDRRALELGMEESQSLAEVIRYLSERVIDPAVRAYLGRALSDTRELYSWIESEYAHQMAMVHETDIDTYVRE